MAQDKTQEVKAVETNEAVTTTTANETVTATSDIIVLPVIRQPFTSGKDKKEYYGYVVKGNIVRVKNGQRLEKEVKVDLVAKDQGGYEVLDIIFFETEEAMLRIFDKTMTDSKTGEKSTYTVYEVYSEDDDGTINAYPVKPSRESDKALLSMLIHSLNAGGGQA